MVVVQLMNERPRAMLSRIQREALQRALIEAVRESGSQAAVGAKLGVSQQAINKAIRFAEVGPTIQRALLEALNLDMSELMAKYALPGDEVYPSRARAVEAARLVGVAPAAIDAVLAEQIAGEDPGALYWLERILECAGRSDN